MTLPIGSFVFLSRAIEIRSSFCRLASPPLSATTGEFQSLCAWRELSDEIWFAERSRGPDLCRLTAIHSCTLRSHRDRVA